MSDWVAHLQCSRCHTIHSSSVLYKCPKCGGILEVAYRWEGRPKSLPVEDILARRPESMWQFRELLPLSSHAIPVSIHEGWTPLIPTERLGRKSGMPFLWVKNEAANPTGSFKDRPVSVAVSKALELGMQGVVTASSGNAGASVAAYAAKGGLPALVLAPTTTPTGKLSQIAMCGATVVLVRGSYSDCWRLAHVVAKRLGWYNITTTFLSAFPTEGNKTVAYEIYLQLGNSVPDWVIVPVGAGPLLVGILRGFRDLVLLGLAHRVPRMVAVQAQGCAPIARAFEAGAREVTAWGVPATIASGIADSLQGYEDDGTHTLNSCRRSDGQVVSVSDEEILAAMEALAMEEGLLFEPTAAAPLAGARKLSSQGVIRPEDHIVLMGTGHGLKDPVAMQARVSSMPVIDVSEEQLLALPQVRPSECKNCDR